MAISKEKQKKIQTERTKQILHAAIRLFDINGYEKTKIEDIANAANISKGLIYRYFPSKEDILFALTHNIDDCLQECQSQPTAKESILLFSLRLLSYPYYQDYIPPLRIFFSAIIQDHLAIEPDKFPVQRNFGREYFGRLFKRGQEEGTFREGNPAAMGDLYWKYLVGNLAVMRPDKKNATTKQEIEDVLAFFEK